MNIHRVGAMSAAVGVVVGFGIAWLGFCGNVESGIGGLSLWHWAQCSLQEVDASVLAVLGEAGCVIETHEFDATTGGKAAGHTAGGKPIEITYVPDNQMHGHVSLRVAVSQLSPNKPDDVLSYQSFLQRLLVSICYVPKCGS